MSILHKPVHEWARALLFDFDFTLGDSSAAVVECVNFALQQVGAPFATPSAIKKTIGLPLDIIFRQFCPQHVDAAIPLFMDCADRIMVDKTEMYPGVIDALQRVADETDLQIAVISTKNHLRIVEIMARFRLSGIVRVIVGVDDIPNPKPAPDATLLALKLLECPASEALFIGDSRMDAGSAKAAGVAFCGVTTGTTSAAQLAEAGALTTYANTAAALEDLLLNHLNKLPAGGDQREFVMPALDSLQNEVEISYFKSSGPGGQKKNKTSSAVRIRHIPTGIIVVATESRSQHKNRELAWQRLIARLEKLAEKPKPRKRTRPPAAAKAARLQKKKVISAKKQMRKPPSIDE